ncbi:hypothetical protein PTQ21_18680 [Paenibacillus marchantiae]|nr:hypothetical protein [Paenibacillus marchantiae]WDQ30465.1 hypothetical protein PTQ21_18680 [Paenibacillus marchantiae]
MGNVGIALGGGKAFSAPALLVLLIIFFTIIGIGHILKKART